MPAILKPCPWCGKLIYPQARHCSYCGTEAPFITAHTHEKWKNILAAAIAVICLTLSVLLLI